MMHWKSVLNSLLPFVSHLTRATDRGLQSQERVKEAISLFQSMVESTVEHNKAQYVASGNRKRPARALGELIAVVRVGALAEVVAVTAGDTGATGVGRGAVRRRWIGVLGSGNA